MQRPNSRAVLMAITVAASLLIPSRAMAAVDVFLTMTNIIGESTIEKDAMTILSWSWGTSTGSARSAKGVLPAACVQDLNLMKQVDSASPQLVMNGVTGTVAREAVLTMRRPGKSEYEFLILRMTNVTVNSFQISGSSELPMESVSLRFETMTGEYYRQKPDGTPDTPVTFTVGGAGCK